MERVKETYDEVLQGKKTAIWPGGFFHFNGWGDHGFDHMTPDEKHGYRFFIPPRGLGLTNLARLNRSIEAYVYCILGAQVNTRSPIVSQSGASQETQQEFGILFESAVIENDISKSIQRYQFAIQEAKVRLDYAVAPGCWLMPSDLVINTHSVVGYNNQLQKATEDMTFGKNDIKGPA